MLSSDASSESTADNAAPDSPAEANQPANPPTVIAVASNATSNDHPVSSVRSHASSVAAAFSAFSSRLTVSVSSVPSVVSRSLLSDAVASPLLLWSFPIVLALQSFSSVILFLCVARLHSGASLQSSSSVFGLFILVISSIISLLFLSLCTVILIFSLRSRHVKTLEILSMYLGTILLFADFYRLIYSFDAASFRFPIADNGRSIFEVHVAFIYFSTQTQTSTGFGDMGPLLVHAKMACMSQQLISLIYTVVVFGVGLDHLRLSLKSYRPAQEPLPAAASFFRSWRRSHPTLDRIRKAMLAYVFPISGVVQILMISFLFIFSESQLTDPSHSQRAGILVIIAIFQLIQFLLISMVLLKLIRSISHRHIKIPFLFQSYLSSVFLFAGLYFMIYFINGPSAWELGSTDQNPVRSFALFGEFIWYSLTTMTTCGFGDAYPIHVLSRLLVCCQMLIGVFFSIVILGMGMAHTGLSLSWAKKEEEKRRNLQTQAVNDATSQNDDGDVDRSGMAIELQAESSQSQSAVPDHLEERANINHMKSSSDSDEDF